MKLSVLVAKVVLFAVIVLWTFLFLAVGLAAFPYFTTAISTLLADAHEAIYVAFVAWYVLTIVVVGVLGASRAFRVIGKWVKKNETTQTNS